MLPLSRRPINSDTSDVEAAKLLVSEAEKRALDTATRLCQEAEELLLATTRLDAQHSQVAAPVEMVQVHRYLAEADEYIAWAKAESERIMEKARNEAASLLTRAIETVDFNTAKCAAAREEQEASTKAVIQARAEADKELKLARQARREAERHLAEVSLDQALATALATSAA